MALSLELSTSNSESSKKGCALIKDLINNNKKVFSLATGSSVISFYHELIKEYNNGEIDFSTIHTFNLDEDYKIDQSYSLSY